MIDLVFWRRTFPRELFIRATKIGASEINVYFISVAIFNINETGENKKLVTLEDCIRQTAVLMWGFL